MSNGEGRSITRTRERLACTECRRRKLKCDRSVPCGACIRRGCRDVCTYQRFANGSVNSAQDAARHSRAEERLQHLETVVTSLIAQQREPPAIVTPAQSRSDGDARPQAPNATADLSAEQQGFSHHGSTHWVSVLEDIQSLKLDLSVQGEEEAAETELGVPDRPNASSLGVVFGAPAGQTLEDVLSTLLPPRQEVDRLTSAYFRSQSIASPFIHSRYFQRLYQDFWAAPLRTPPLWISILFSILHVSKNALRPGKEGQVQPQDNEFAVAAARCLTIGEYFRPKKFAVEAVLLFAHSHCFTQEVLPPELGPLVATLVRIATAMGYHQASSTRKYSPFEQEMRRRVWSLCMQLDLLIAFHLGQPSAMNFARWPTEAPSNLSDVDFDESSAQLPPPRPCSEPTGISFVIAKHKFMVVFDKVLTHALQAQEDPTTMEAEVDALDTELRDVYDALPEAFRPRRMADSVFDSSSVIITRLCTTFLHCKCLVVLHRTYLLRGRPGSLDICFDAASTLVCDYADAVDEFRPGGQVENEGWFMTSFSWHDFLLGTVALCLVVLVGSGQARLDAEKVGVATELLARAQHIAAKQEGNRTRETRRIRLLVEKTLRRLTSDEGLALNVAGHHAGENVFAALGDQDADVRMGGSLWDGFLEQYLNLGDDAFMDFVGEVAAGEVG